jgi:hypothetical protein
MPRYRQLKVRDCQGTLWAFYRQYEGMALASFEGDLRGLRLQEIPGFSTSETASLRRQTFSPELDFCIVPIASDTIAILKKKFSMPGVLGENGVVIHTQLEVSEQAVLIACDNFHDDCTVAAETVPDAFLEELKSRGLIRSYQGDA